MPVNPADPVLTTAEQSIEELLGHLRHKLITRAILWQARLNSREDAVQRHAQEMAHEPDEYENVEEPQLDEEILAEMDRMSEANFAVKTLFPNLPKLRKEFDRTDPDAIAEAFRTELLRSLFVEAHQLINEDHGKYC